MLNIRSKAGLRPIAKLRLKRRPASTPFEKLVEEAIAVTRRINELSDPKTGKLSAEGFFKETLAITGNSPKDAQELRTALECGRTGLDNCRRVLRRMMTELRKPTLASPPTEDHWTRTERWLTDTESRAELLKVKSNAAVLLAVAIQRVEEETPDVFGKQSSTRDVQAKLAELRARQETLFTQIATRWTASDVDPGTRDPRSGNVSGATFKLSDGSVAIAPADSAGKRLVDCIIANRGKTN